MAQISRISQKKSTLQGDLHLRNLSNLCYLRMSFGRWLARAVTHQGQTITPALDNSVDIWRHKLGGPPTVVV